MAGIYPWTVIWWDPFDHELHDDRVWAQTPNEAVASAVQVHYQNTTYDSNEVELLMVFRGHVTPESIEWDDRFTWFNKENPDVD